MSPYTSLRALRLDQSLGGVRYPSLRWCGRGFREAVEADAECGGAPTAVGTAQQSDAPIALGLQGNSSRATIAPPARPVPREAFEVPFSAR
jgi:hypothetical protein